LVPAVFVGSCGPEELAAGPGISGLAGARGLGSLGAFHDDAVDVGGRVALVGEAGVDKPTQNVEEGLDASEGAEPEADLGRARERDSRFFENQIRPVRRALRPRQGPERESEALHVCAFFESGG